MKKQAHSLIDEAASTDEVHAALATLRARENDIVLRLDAIRASRKVAGLDLNSLDSLHVGLGARGRRIENDALAHTANMSKQLSGRVRQLELEKNRVEETLQMVAHVAELKAYVAGAVGSVGAAQDWEAAASYLSQASKVPEEVTRGAFAAAMVPTIEAPDSPWTTLESTRDSLCTLFLREFKEAAERGDSARVTRVFKLFPLIDRSDIGLDAYAKYICERIADTARVIFKQGTEDRVRRGSLFFGNALGTLFEHIAHIVEMHGTLVERDYGAGQMAKVIERLQVEVDVRGSITLDVWCDEREVDRKLTHVKSYPFSFLAQNLLSQRAIRGAGGSNRPDSYDEVVDTKEIDELLGEMTLMLGRWSLYSQFIARRCSDADSSGHDTLTTPRFLQSSNLNLMISDKINTPYLAMATFFIRRSVEKAFQMDKFPNGLSLTKPIHGNPPFTIQAVDDIMFVVDNLMQKALSTFHGQVFTLVISAIGRVLESDFIGVLRGRMQNECYPKPSVPGGLPPENKTVNFIVLMNSLDMSREYLDRIFHARFGKQADGSNCTSWTDAFPFDQDVELDTKGVDVMKKSFSSKASELLNHGLHALFEEVAKPRMRLILTRSFQDAYYNLSQDDVAEETYQGEDDEMLQRVPKWFEDGWDALMKPLARIMTPTTYAELLTRTARYLATLLEKRVWSYSGSVNTLGVIRMERDLSGIVSVVSKRDYKAQQPFDRVKEILLVATMDEEEWQDVTSEGFECTTTGVLTGDERHSARMFIR